MGQSTRPASYGGLRVLIAGGGVGGLEATLAMRELAGDLVDIEVLSPDPYFWYRPISVGEPFDPTLVHRFEVSTLAGAAGAAFTLAALYEVDADDHLARTTTGCEIPYDVLVIASGTRAVSAVEGALTFRGPADVDAFRGLLTELESGAATRVVFAVPRGVLWPLPLYELALLTSAHLRSKELEGIELSLVTPEESPLALLGAAASDAVAGLLDQSGIAFHSGSHPVSAEENRLNLDPPGSLPADRVVALARLEGQPIMGIPQDGEGFITTRRTGRVAELPDVYAVGDITRFPIKQGGIATQQADVVAEQIALQAGATVTRSRHAPVVYALLLTGGEPLYIKAELAKGHAHRSTVSTEPLWWPPAKVVGRHLAPFLASQSLGAHQQQAPAG